MNLSHDSMITIRDLSYSRALLLKSQLEAMGVICYLSNHQTGLATADLHLEASMALQATQLLESSKTQGFRGKEAAVTRLRGVRRILVPVDFSERSVKAAHYALELARRLKAEIKLLHVWFSGAGESFIFNEMFAFQTDLEPVMREMEQQAMDKLTELADILNGRIRAERMRGVKLGLDLVRGNAVDSILEIASDYQPGLIVMGTRGKNRDALSLMGSTTSRLIAKSSFPILAVPEGYDISKFFAPHKVAYITHFDENDFLAMHRLITFVKPFKAQIFCLHLLSKPDAEVDRLRMKQLRDYFNTNCAATTIECGLIETAEPVGGVEAFVQEKQVDVIAILFRRRNLLEQLFEPSLTRKLLYQTHLPLLVFSE